MGASFRKPTVVIRQGVGCLAYYMCECPTLAACIQWMIQTREYTFQTEQNVAVWHVVVRAGDYVLYDSESNADAFCCLEEALEKAVQECMELLY